MITIGDAISDPAFDGPEFTATRRSAVIRKHIRHALEAADYAYLVSRGKIVLEGPAKEMLDRVDDIERTYLEAGELTDAAG